MPVFPPENTYNRNPRNVAGIFAGQGGKVPPQIGGAKAVGMEMGENDGIADEPDAEIDEA